MRIAAIKRMIVFTAVLALVGAVFGGGLSSTGSSAETSPCPMHDTGVPVGPTNICCPDCLPDGVTHAACAGLCQLLPATLASALMLGKPVGVDFIDPTIHQSGGRTVDPEPLPPRFDA